MPIRFLRPGITSSEKWNSLNWVTQSFYIRILTLVDDYGRYDANPQLLRSHAFPLQTDDINCKQVLTMCEQLQKADLATFYEVSGKKYLQLQNWKEKARSEPKFPSFDNNCMQMFADDNKCSPSSSSSSSSISPSLVVDRFEEFWKEYPKKRSKGDAIKAWRNLKVSDELFDKIIKAIQFQKTTFDWTKDNGKFIPYPATWLNRKCWEDEVPAQNQSKPYTTHNQFKDLGIV